MKNATQWITKGWNTNANDINLMDENTYIIKINAQILIEINRDDQMGPYILCSQNYF
jgi:hypothetical protein